MNINSTLLVQMANVVIAYILFDFILIKPLARIMQQEDTTEKQLLMTIQQAQDAIQKQELEFQRQKREWRLRFMTAVPSLSRASIPHIEVTLEKEPELESLALDQLVSPIAKYMIKKAEDECITHQ
jgi:hypothetical protein